MKFRLYGDICHPGIVEVEADTLDQALDRATDGEFKIIDEQHNCLAFHFAGTALDENGKEIE